MLKLIQKNYRSSNNEIFIALRTIIIFIERVTKKFKLQTILDEIRKLIFESN